MEIGGYTDDVGTDRANNSLSLARANAIRKYLIEKRQITESRLKTVGYGEKNPIAPNTTDAGRAANRRVELKVLGLTDDVYYVVTKDGRRFPANYVVTSNDNQTVSYRENENAPLVRIPAASVDYIEYPDGTQRPVGMPTGPTVVTSPNDPVTPDESGTVGPPEGPGLTERVGEWFITKFPKVGRWSLMANAGVMPLTVDQARIDFAYVDESPSKDNLTSVRNLKEATLAPGGQIGFDLATDKFVMLRAQYQFARSSQAGFSGFLFGVGKGFGKKGRFSANLDVTLGSAFLKMGNLVQNDVFIQVNDSRFYSQKVRIKFRNYFAALTPQLSYDLDLNEGMSLRLSGGYAYSFNTKSSLIFKGQDNENNNVKGREDISASNVSFRVNDSRQTEVNLFGLQGPYGTIGFLYHIYRR